jgi:hypothetical protein
VILLLERVYGGYVRDALGSYRERYDEAAARVAVLEKEVDRELSIFNRCLKRTREIDPLFNDQSRIKD